MEDKAYVMITIGHPTFYSGQICIISLSTKCEYLSTYEQLAKEKACEELGVNHNNAAVLDFMFLGRDIKFIIDG